MTDYGCSHDEMLLLVPEKYLQGVIPNHVRRKDKADGGGAPQDKVTARDRERFERWAHLGILQVYVWHHSEGFVAPRVSPPGPLSISYTATRERCENTQPRASAWRLTCARAALHRRRPPAPGWRWRPCW